jgi:hypothetical protein
MVKFYFRIIVLVLAFVLIGCATVQKKQANFEVTGYTNDDCVVTVVNHIQFGDSWYESANPEKVISGFSVNIKNNGKTPIKIIWDNSSITDQNGTHRFFLSGMRYIESNNSIPASVIPSNGNISRDVYNADNVEYVSYAKTWRVNPMYGFNFTLLLCIEQDGKENYLNVNINVVKI